jgi:hypothetical protein
MRIAEDWDVQGIRLAGKVNAGRGLRPEAKILQPDFFV